MSQYDTGADTPTPNLNAAPDHQRPSQTSTGRAVALMAISSFLVPLAGLMSQPLLAHGLGVEGRGALAAAAAPAVLIFSVATLGLPEALTYHLAKKPELTRRALFFATIISIGLGLLCLGITFLLLPVLSSGDPNLSKLIFLAVVLAIPALLTGVLRGAAVGRQMWTTVATEKVAACTTRLFALGGLTVAGHLTVLTAVIVTMVTPTVSGLVYLRLLFRPPEKVPGPAKSDGLAAELISFGCRMWLGAIAGMLLARLGELMIAPLSNVEQLGLFSVANTISDIPLIVAGAMQGALFGVNSLEQDRESLARTCRVSVLLALIGCLILSISLPLWIGVVFGQGFVAATLPAILMLAAAVLCVPGTLTAGAVAAWGRPGMRSAILGGAILCIAVLFGFLVPSYGAVGAAISILIGSFLLSVFMVGAAGMLAGVQYRRFILTEMEDARAIRRQLEGLWSKRRFR